MFGLIHKFGINDALFPVDFWHKGGKYKMLFFRNIFLIILMSSVIDAVYARTIPLSHNITKIQKLTSASTTETIATGTHGHSCSTPETVSLTVTDTVQTIASLSFFNLFIIKQWGTGTVYLDIGGSDATDTDFPLYASDTIILEKIEALATMSVISASGQSNTVSIIKGEQW